MISLTEFSLTLSIFEGVVQGADKVFGTRVLCARLIFCFESLVLPINQNAVGTDLLNNNLKLLVHRKK